MQVLKIDGNALIPAPPVAPATAVSGEPGPEEILAGTCESPVGPT